MSSDPQEDFEAAWHAGSGGWPELAVCVVLGPPLLLLAAGVGAVHAVAGGLRGLRGWARRWPAPSTLGVLTNDEIDRLPSRPGRS